jgi:hypothetical protein
MLKLAFGCCSPLCRFAAIEFLCKITQVALRIETAFGPDTAHVPSSARPVID